MMKKEIKDILPNPFRNFDIYPLGEPQIEKLLDSISDLGLWSGLPARKVGKKYEIACGHHRLEAAKRAGLKKIDLAVQEYTDDEMISIMVTENMTQRGHENFGAVLDSAAACIVQIVKGVLTGDIRLQISADVSKALETVKGHIESGKGVGKKSIHALQPSITMHSAEAAVKVLKATTYYAELIRQGGASKEVVALYEDRNRYPIYTSIEAAAMFKNPTEASNWIATVKDNKVRAVLPVENHVALVNSMKTGKEHSIPHKEMVGFIKKQVAKITDEVVIEEEKIDFAKEVRKVGKAMLTMANRITELKELATEELVPEQFYTEVEEFSSIYTLETAINDLLNSIN